MSVEGWMGMVPISLVATRMGGGHAGDEGEHDESGERSCWRRGRFFRGRRGRLPSSAVLYRGGGLGSLPILYRVNAYSSMKKSDILGKRY